jgi:hypothetical protein
LARNIQFQFGYQPFQSAGVAHNFCLSRHVINYKYGTALFRGDPIVTDANSGSVVSSSQNALRADIFWGCEYPGLTVSRPSSREPAIASRGPDLTHRPSLPGVTA